MARASLFPQTIAPLLELTRLFYERGWVLGTGGNFSLLTSRDPLRLLITPSGIHKGELTAEQLVEIGEDGQPVNKAEERPSGESLLHLAVAKATGALAVSHTHSIWSTVISDLFLENKGVALEGYEMLKALPGVKTHQHREWIPVLENSQEMKGLALQVEALLKKQTGLHAFLLHKHGLYTWGKSVADLKRHAETLEFLLETHGQIHFWRSFNHGFSKDSRGKSKLQLSR